jgi:hypothetical protein
MHPWKQKITKCGWNFWEVFAVLSRSFTLKINCAIKSWSGFSALADNKTHTHTHAHNYKPLQLPARRSHTSQPRNSPTLSSVSLSLPPPSSGSLWVARIAGNSSLPFLALRGLALRQNYASQRVLRQRRRAGSPSHLTRVGALQWRRPCCAGASLENVGL